MRTTHGCKALLLLRLIDLVSSVPISLHGSTSNANIWVTKQNTLNATTWDVSPHHSPLIVVAGVEVQSSSSRNATTVVAHGPNDRPSPSSYEVSTQTVIANPSSTNGTRPYRNGTHIANATASGIPHPTGFRPTGTGPPLGTGRPSANASAISTATAHSWNTTTTTSLGLAPTVAVTLLEASAGTLPIALVNNMASSNVKVYISGLDTNGALIMLGQGGGWEYPTTTSGVPVAIANPVELSLGAPNTTTTFVLPTYITSGRIWISVGPLQFFVVATPLGPGLVQPASANPDDPNAEVNYGFAELSWGSQYGLYADITNVDYVGLPLGIELTQADNSRVSILGTPSDAAPALCNQLKAQAQVDGRPWDQLCAYDSAGALVRVLAPSTYTASQPGSFGTYFSRYVNDVWDHYRTNDLIIDAQNNLGNVTCRVHGALLQCAGDNRGYAKPNVFDIFGCNTGPFAILQGDNAVHYAVVPRLCAAFNRVTLLVPGGNVQPSLPPSAYYNDDNRPVKSRPKNWYSKLVHDMEIGGRGYAFAYDDVTPSQGEDQSGLVSSTSPTALKIIVGGT